MTPAQLRYREYREQQRHNIETEQLTGRQISETERANRSSEEIRREANAIQQYGIDVNARTAIETANIAAESAKYSADKHYESTVYASDNSRAAAEYAAQLSSQTSRFNTLLSTRASLQQAHLQAETSEHAADRSYAGTVYSSDSNVAQNEARIRSSERIAAAQLAFDKQRQSYTETLQNKKLELDRLLNAANVARTEADTNRIIQDTAKVAQDVEIALQDYALRARQQGNNDELTKANVALTKVKTVESGLTSVQSAVSTAQKIQSIIEEALHGT